MKKLVTTSLILTRESRSEETPQNESTPNTELNSCHDNKGPGTAGASDRSGVAAKEIESTESQ